MLKANLKPEHSLNLGMQKIRFILIIFIGIFALPTSSFCQSEKITELEADLPNYSGRKLVRQTVKLSRYYLSEGFNDKAHDVAYDAYLESKRSVFNDYIAISLHQCARAYLEKQTPTAVELEKVRQYLLIAFNKVDGTDLNKLILENNLLQNQYEIAVAKFKGEDEPKKRAGLAVLSDVLKGKTNEAEILEEEIAEGVENNDGKSAQRSNAEKTDKFSLNGDQGGLLNDRLDRLMKEIKNMKLEQLQQEYLLTKKQNILDSLKLTSVLDSLDLAEKEFELAKLEFESHKKDNVIALQNSQRNVLMAIAVIFLLIAAVIFIQFFNSRRYNKTLSDKNEMIEKEKERSESLLLNILPAIVARELKESGKAAARKYDKVSVLFTDFKNFSKIAEHLTPEELVNELDYCFRKFDEIVVKFGLEKIKTIGDSYMCAGGLPEPNGVATASVVRAALEMQDFLLKWKQEQIDKGSPYFEARVGIHTGPLVAGVVGSRKFAYDIWGDTVNIASRMESSGEIEKVNVSEATYDEIKDEFKCTYRGKIEAKNKGHIDMYFVEELEDA